MFLTNKGIRYALISVKEKSDFELSEKMRRDGLITFLGALFERSQKQEINSLIVGGVFEFI
jgi:hypothetical protein